MSYGGVTQAEYFGVCQGWRVINFDYVELSLGIHRVSLEEKCSEISIKVTASSKGRKRTGEKVSLVPSERRARGTMLCRYLQCQECQERGQYWGLRLEKQTGTHSEVSHNS